MSRVIDWAIVVAAALMAAVILSFSLHPFAVWSWSTIRGFL